MTDSVAGLAWNTAWKIAWRDLRASWAKFVFVVLAVALGVGSLTGIRSFSVVFERTLLQQARTIMAADLSAQEFHPYTDSELLRLGQLGVQHTPVTETVSMASIAGNPNPLLVSLKVIDPAKYPYYGSVQLASGRRLRDVLSDDAAVVSEEFLLRTHARLGAVLHLGDRQFHIVDVLASEPDRISSSFSIGPRVMIAQTALPGTGLIRPGSRASERMLFYLPSADSQKHAMNIEQVRRKIEIILPEATITDFREVNPALADGLHRSTAMLTLISLVTLVLSAIGVAMAMRAHLKQRLDTIGIMKALGARSSQVMRIYLLQTLFLGVVGAGVGVIAGAAVARVFPLLLHHLISLPVDARLAIGPGVVGLLTGILTTLLFTLPPLLEIRNFHPLHILRRNVEEESGSFVRIYLRDRIQIATTGIILLALAAIAGTLTDSAMVGGWFAGGLFAVMLFLLFAAWAILMIVRRLLQRGRSRLSPAVRQGLANLYRPGNQSAGVLTALGVGVMLIVTLYAMQHAIVLDLNETNSTKTPNVFLVDVSSSELPGVTQLIAAQPAAHGGLETLPIVAARILSIDGVRTENLHLQHAPKGMLRSTALTWADDLPAGEKIVAGHWWRKENSNAPLAVSEHAAGLLHLKLGSQIEFEAGEEHIQATVVALYRSDGEHIYGRSQFILPSRILAGQPVTWYGAFHAEPARVGEVERSLFAAYPTISVINVADVMEVVRKAVEQISAIIRFLAGFTMLAGGIILASSVTASRLQRVREVAILKSLGALRSQIVSMLTVEFLVLGGIAGIAGVLFALVLSAVLLRQLEVSFHPGWPVCICAVFATAILSSLVGWLASLRILEQKPLAVLRDE